MYDELEASYWGYYEKQKELESVIANLKRLIGNKPKVPLAYAEMFPEKIDLPTKGQPHRKFSRKTRLRMSRGQQKRWAEYRQQQARTAIAGSAQKPTMAILQKVIAETKKRAVNFAAATPRSRKRAGKKSVRRKK